MAWLTSGWQDSVKGLPRAASAPQWAPNDAQGPVVSRSERFAEHFRGNVAAVCKSARLPQDPTVPTARRLSCRFGA